MASEGNEASRHTGVIFEVDMDKDGKEAAPSVPAERHFGSCSSVKWEGKERSPNRHISRHIALLIWVLEKLKTPYTWIDASVTVLLTSAIAAGAVIIWLCVIPVGDPYTGNQRNRAVWVFLINPGATSGFVLCGLHVFFALSSPKNPWRPARNYVHILLINYGARIVFPGLYVFVRTPFELCGLAAYGLAGLVMVIALVSTPRRWNEDKQSHWGDVICFSIIIFIFVVPLQVVVAGYVILIGYAAEWEGRAESIGKLSAYVGLALKMWILRKIVHRVTVHFPVVNAQFVAAFWLANASDAFMTMAYPDLLNNWWMVGFLLAFKTGEKMFLLGKMTMAWVRFRAGIHWVLGWCIGRKLRNSEIVEEDLDPEDRGLGNQVPGYRRKQVLFLVAKATSLACAHAMWMAASASMYYGPNRWMFPFAYGACVEQGGDCRSVPPGSVLPPEAWNTLDKTELVNSILYAASLPGTSLLAVLLSLRIVERRYPKTYQEVFVTQNYLLQDNHWHVTYSLWLSMLATNYLWAVSSLHVYYRIYWFKRSPAPASTSKPAQLGRRSDTLQGQPGCFHRVGCSCRLREEVQRQGTGGGGSGLFGWLQPAAAAE